MELGFQNNKKHTKQKKSPNIMVYMRAIRILGYLREEAIVLIVLCAHQVTKPFPKNDNMRMRHKPVYIFHMHTL